MSFDQLSAAELREVSSTDGKSRWEKDPGRKARELRNAEIIRRYQGGQSYRSIATSMGLGQGLVNAVIVRYRRRKQTPQRLRKASTDAERKLWGVLRSRGLGDWKFRRQAPIDHYTVDFLCFDARLIVEVDGGHHQEQVAHDEERAKWLESQGFSVLRFWNNEVLTETQSVLESILVRLETLSHSDCG